MDVLLPDRVVAMCCRQTAQLPAKLQQRMILLSSYSVKIGYSAGAWVIAEQFVALLEEIPAESNTPNKPVWEHKDVLLDMGEPKGDKEDVAHAIPSVPHMTACFDGACHEKKGAGGFVIYGSEG